MVALAFDFLNGFNDSGNIVATMISSGAMSPKDALLLASVAEFVGPFVFGVAIARTIAQGIVNAEAVSVPVVVAALSGAVIWAFISMYFAVPSSATHALIGGLVGASIVAHGIEAVNWDGVARIVGLLLLAPVVGGFLGYLAMKATLYLARGATPAANVLFKRLQIITSVALALSHGTNDAQKTMGVITLALVSYGALPGFEVPSWVVAVSAAFLSLGIALGGSGMITKLGSKIYRIRPVHGFAAQAASSTAVLAAAALGAPISATQVVGSAIVGVGAAERRSKVRWAVAGSILTAWLLTLPTAALVAALAYGMMNLV